MAYEFKLPDVGEGLHEGEVVKWHVKEGDPIHENQPMVDVLTDKATVEIPSPKTGKVAKLLAAPGQIVKVGEGLVLIEVEGASSSDGPGRASIPAVSPPAGAFQPNLGPAPLTVAVPPSAGRGAEVLATPAVRKLAKDLGVNLEGVRGTGPQGRITEDDVRGQTSKAPEGGWTPAVRTSYGPEERAPLKGIRRKTAEKMAFSKRTVAHVTHVDEADVTALAALREEMKREAESKGVKLTYLPFIVRAVVKALKEYPALNGSLDDERQEIVYKRYYNIGIATATPNGLFNPVVKNADRLDLWQLSKEIERLSGAARSGEVALPDLQGGTFTITNIGPIGGLSATPIVVHPETAILAVMKIQKRPVVREGQVVVRDMLNLCLSFDHRVLDGAEAALFTNTLVKHLENPRTLL